MAAKGEAALMENRIRIMAKTNAAEQEEAEAGAGVPMAPLVALYCGASLQRASPLFAL